MEFEEVIKKRHSTRLFSDKKLEKEKLDKILEAARIAPTARNTQPFKIYVVESKEGIKKIDKASSCRYNAPTVLLVLGDKEKSYIKNDQYAFDIDTSIVNTHMILEATNLGVDSVWVEGFDEKIIKEEFNVPDNLVVVNMLPLGYKSEECPPSPMHDTRKNIEELVEYK